MKNFYTQYKKEIYFFAGCIAFIAIVVFSFSTCGETVNPSLPASTITTPAKSAAAEIDLAADKLKVELKKSKDSITSFKTKWYAAVQENKRLRNSRLKIESSKPDSSNEPDNTAADYFTDLSASSTTADSLCEKAITHLETALETSEEINKMEREKSAIFSAAMDKLANNSDLKDKEIKAINKKLKWQKAQNIGLKAVVIAGAVFILKNNLKW